MAMDVKLSVLIVFSLLWQGFSFRVPRVELVMNELVLVYNFLSALRNFPANCYGANAPAPSIIHILKGW